MPPVAILFFSRRPLPILNEDPSHGAHICALDRHPGRWTPLVTRLRQHGGQSLDALDDHGVAQVAVAKQQRGWS